MDFNIKNGCQMPDKWAMVRLKWKIDMKYFMSFPFKKWPSWSVTNIEEKKKQLKRSLCKHKLMKHKQRPSSHQNVCSLPAHILYWICIFISILAHFYPGTVCIILISILIWISKWRKYFYIPLPFVARMWTVLGYVMECCERMRVNMNRIFPFNIIIKSVEKKISTGPIFHLVDLTQS